MMLQSVAVVVACVGLVVRADSDDTIKAATEVMQRLTPTAAHNFQFHIVDAPPLSPRYAHLRHATNETIVVSARNGSVTVRASSGVGLCAGAYWYIKNVAKGIVTWGVNGSGSQLACLDGPLPDLPLTAVSSPVPWRYAWNPVTFGYSALWWDAARWQREIDWWALHGVNLALALTAQEYVWIKVFASYNVSLDELQSWLTGPAFLPWQRFGNVRRFAGPLPLSWILGQRDLQLGILRSMRRLGIRAVLPCFGGHVPSVAQRIFPQANFTPSAAWNHFPPSMTHVWMVDPTSPTYQTIGADFMRALIAEFGSDGMYNCDTFNEVDPPHRTAAYLRGASAAVVSAVRRVDPTGVWVMQGWLFHSNFWNTTLVERYLSGVDNSSMLILDLNSEAGVLATEYHHYYGKAWVWNLLHNFGGVRGMYGNLTCVATEPSSYLLAEGSTMAGIGFTPEAIEQNPVIYELLTDTFFHHSAINVKTWLARYVEQRYGVRSPALEVAWGLLFVAVYDQPGEPRSEIEWVPHWELADYGWQNGDSSVMMGAFRVFMSAVRDMPNATRNGPLMYDLVDVARQATTMYFSDLHRQVSSEAYAWASLMRQNSTASLAALGQRMTTLIATLDDLLGSDPNYLLGTWTGGARAWATDGPAQEALFSYNAKNLITMWGPQAQICDYAAKAWAGLYGTYYHTRWSIFMQRLVEAVAANALWNGTAVEHELFHFEVQWNANATQEFSPIVNGQDTVDVAGRLLGLMSFNVSSAYNTLPDTDTPPMFDMIIAPTWTRDVQQLATMCNLMDDCVGFNDRGWLKTGTETIPVMGSTLHLHRERTAAVRRAAAVTHDRKRSHTAVRRRRMSEFSDHLKRITGH